MSRAPRPVAWVVSLGLPVLLFALWFVIPMGVFGPQHPVASWISFGLALVGVAITLLRQIQQELLGERGHPVLVIVMLLCFSILLFSTAYLAMARTPGEFQGISTKVDALYFTVITMATVGYGDIVPSGQVARVVVMLQILYTLVFLTAGATAINRRLRSSLEQRVDRRRHRG
ncbi:potassium channel family protein [Kitasatospora sp. NPDC088346]|uniref:potassium channel family protein n=1 Tax=Kitasatospora sp. NPDC088346 TaxID=3364073 RepID=UPI003815E00E